MSSPESNGLTAPKSHWPTLRVLLATPVVTAKSAQPAIRAMLRPSSARMIASMCDGLVGLHAVADAKSHQVCMPRQAAEHPLDSAAGLLWIMVRRLRRTGCRRTAFRRGPLGYPGIGWTERIMAHGRRKQRVHERRGAPHSITNGVCDKQSATAVACRASNIVHTRGHT